MTRALHLPGAWVAVQVVGPATLCRHCGQERRAHQRSGAKTGQAVTWYCRPEVLEAAGREVRTVSFAPSATLSRGNP